VSPELERHYHTLELPLDASPEEIRRAYRDLVQVWHPDRFGSKPRLRLVAEEKLRAINAAYEALERTAAGSPAKPPPSEPAPASEPQAATCGRATEYPKPPASARARTAAAWPFTQWLAHAWIRTAVFAILFVAVLAGGRQLYQALLGPVQATDSLLGDAARRMGRPPGLSNPALPGLAVEVPGLGSIERFSRLWASAPRQTTQHVAPSPAEPPARQRGSSAGRPRAPRPAEEGYLALPNGTELITPGGKKGYGVIRVVNVTDHEAAAELTAETAPGTTLRLVYIRAGTAVNIEGIGGGIYYLSFRLGEEWLPVSRDFARDRAHGGPVGPLPFFQYRTAEGTQSDRYEITLKPEAAAR